MADAAVRCGAGPPARGQLARGGRDDAPVRRGGNPGLRPARNVTIARQDITGLVLAGGRGSRMGGVDKGLQNHQGVPLALHALLRLQPQVGEAMINANRNLGAYESMGVPVWPDAQSDFPGPLAGVLAGLERCETPYRVPVPWDTAKLPLDPSEGP